MWRVLIFASFLVFLASLTSIGALAHSRVRNRPPQAAAAPPATAYVGSAACRDCHTAIYDRWAKTRMANVVRDPRTHPDAIIPDLSTPDPLLTFKKEDIAFVYGSKWKQRYFTKVGNDYFPFPAQWDITNRVWRPYFVQPNTDWWVPFYPADNTKRPTGPLCDGCHSVNYNVKTKTVTEWNVGCEKCHGPGHDHVQRPVAATIVNPARLVGVKANDVCMQCHSQGKPLENPIEGQQYDWPVGYRAGLDLKDFWELEEHKLGETTFTHFGDGSAHKNRMQGNDFAQSLMYARGVICSSCHDVHGTANNADLRRPAAQVCLTCHGPKSVNGPHAISIEAHTHHRRDGAGSDCVACHMPRTAQTIANVNVRSHTFKFVTPALTDDFKIPNPCLGCHADRNTAWARGVMREWSPWRLQ
jgi:predicted CXXCH cytochrome family protein